VRGSSRRTCRVRVWLQIRTSRMFVSRSHLTQLNLWDIRGTYFTKSRAADQKAGMELVANVRAKYKVATKGLMTQNESTVDEELCLKILEGANFKLDEIRGHLGRSKVWVCCSLLPLFSFSLSIISLAPMSEHPTPLSHSIPPCPIAHSYFCCILPIG
jgi:hypothetical protein